MSGLGNLKIVANIKRKSMKEVEEALDLALHRRRLRCVQKLCLEAFPGTPDLFLPMATLLVERFGIWRRWCRK